MVRALVISVIGIGTGGCPIPVDSGDCAPGDDCGAGAVCTDVAECAPVEGAPPWRIRWTINGAAVSSSAPEACEPIDELILTISAPDDTVTYRPVTCEIGQFDFAALPERYDRLTLEALADGRVLDLAVAGRDAETLLIDLEI